MRLNVSMQEFKVKILFKNDQKCMALIKVEHDFRFNSNSIDRICGMLLP